MSWSDHHVYTFKFYSQYTYDTQCLSLVTLHGVSAHQQLDCLFNISLTRLTTKKASKLCITGSLWEQSSAKDLDLQYIPRNMLMVFALLCFVVDIHWLIFPYPLGLLHWHCGNLTIAPVPAKQPWWIWINTSCEFIMNDCITTTKQSTTKPCAYLLGYTVVVAYDGPHAIVSPGLQPLYSLLQINCHIVSKFDRRF